ncbi:MAG: alanine dehydrogenase [Cyclobacteriaceae bacterium]
MAKVKIALIKEGKIPVDKRVALTPTQAKKVTERFPNVELVVQSSDIRCFTDKDYQDAGLKIVQDVNDCDVLLGVKEVPIPNLIAEKTYFFFSHTIKMQPYNQPLIKEVLTKKIRLIDYETLTDSSGKRIIAFGRWAGIVGAYNGVWTFGQRYKLFDIRRASDCFDLEDLKTEYSKVNLPKIKIAITGGGRVAKGAIEVLLGMGIRKVTPAEYVSERFDEPVFTQLNTRDYHIRKEGGEFSRHEFYKNPELYESDFLKFAKVTDMLIASAFWDPKSPVLFQRSDILKTDFRIKVVADITCDIEGSIPSTKTPSTIEDPIYDYNPSDDETEKALSDEGNITVMAVDNLPCELPRDASESFGNELLNNVLPELLGDDSKDVIKKATITENGELTSYYQYLTNYAAGVAE